MTLDDLQENYIFFNAELKNMEFFIIFFIENCEESTSLQKLTQSLITKFLIGFDF